MRIRARRIVDGKIVNAEILDDVFDIIFGEEPDVLRVMIRRGELEIQGDLSIVVFPRAANTITVQALMLPGASK